MTNIFLFSQNAILDSIIERYGRHDGSTNVFLTTHMLFDFERDALNAGFDNCEFIKFADFLSDEENALCDEEAYGLEQEDLFLYYDMIKRIKNACIAAKVLSRYPAAAGYVLSDDLGISKEIWIEVGFEALHVETYFSERPKTVAARAKSVLKRSRLIKSAYYNLKPYRYPEDVYFCEWRGHKYVFIGKMNRISYRMDMDWEKSEVERDALNRADYKLADECTYLSTLHEYYGRCQIPDDARYDVRYIQDGYLPPNYSSCYLRFKPNNVQYYAWDVLGEENFKLYDVPVSIMPFRKKLYLPVVNLLGNVKTILVATSGPGDWTAQKNRSDEDLMLEAFVEIARRRPGVKVIYRCHPTWIAPVHNGVNSINRAADYIESTGLGNIGISSNLILDGRTLSFPRSSFESDLAQADIVFGEHSVSMLDAAFEGVPFASVNLTGRRNLACGLTDLGFPHCENVDEIEAVLDAYEDGSLERSFNRAVAAYNRMTDEED